jgi:amino acid transporter
MIQAFTVFLALIGTTLSCVSTGARVTYAMGRDEEVPSHFGLLHGTHLTPHKTIWTLAGLSAVIGVICIIGAFWGPAAPSDDTLKALPKNGWYSIGVPATHDGAAALPNTLLAMTLVSNYGTFVLYMLTCLTAMIAFKEHHTFREVKHSVVPMFGFLANLVCMLFYLVGPFSVDGMSWKESYIALGIAALWGIYGLRYFFKSSKAKGKSVWIDDPVTSTPTGTGTPLVAVAPNGPSSTMPTS